jgi:hypothetical protein
MRVKASSCSVITIVIALAGWMLYSQSMAGQQQQQQQSQPAGPGRSGSPEGGITKEQFDRWMTELSNWGRWGKDDELGTLNLITPAKRIQAASLVKAGITVSLSRNITRESKGTSRAFQRGFVNRFAFGTEPQYGEYIEELQEIGYHVSPMTHLDALCHVAYNGMTYNGRKFKEIASEQGGCSKNGIAPVKDAIATRGILVDLPGTPLSRQEIEAWEKKSGLKISAGDALFLRTARTGGDPSIIPFFKERDVAILGGGQDGVIQGVPLPLHVFALVALGMPLLDGVDLEAVAATAAKLQRWEFMFVVAPLPVHNGLGGAVNPVAIF